LYEYNCEVIKGGTGFGMYNNLPDEIDCMPPDYSLYGIKGTSYGFTTRGCVNNCSFCIVPKKEGAIRPYRDITEIAQDNKNIILMDNNILAHPHGVEQLKIAAEKGYRLDCNQGLDARLVTDEIAQILAHCKWIDYIRTACDSHAQIPHIERMHELLLKHGYNKSIFCYCLVRDFDETVDRMAWARQNRWLDPHCQPYRDFNNPNQTIPQWQSDLARWVNRKWLYRAVEFADFEPRKGFKCKQYFKQR
jgi:hypothetical protein